jgi:hypothetical protein
MMQWDERYFLSFCSESEGMGEATVIQTRMHPSQQNIYYKLESCRLCTRKLQMGFLLIDVNMFASFLILPIVKLEQLELIDALYFSIS